jgi:4-amino-4-deoxy-L-arabinose transferase-like glycosyltransferase
MIRAAVRDLLHAYRRPLEIFLWTRSGIWIGAILLAAILDPLSVAFQVPLDPRWQIDIGWGIGIWSRWDSSWFLDIARDGYVDPQKSTAFFPLYPLLVKVTGTILGGHYILAGIIVSLAACAAAFVLLYQLGRELLGEDGAYRAVLYLSLFPMALFLGAVYSESVYLTLSLASFLLALRRRFAFAAVAVGLAILTRSAGIALLPAIGLLAWRSDDRARSLASLLIAPAIAAAWPLWLWVRIGDPFVFLDAQQDAWGRELSPFGPLGGLGRGIEAAWAGIRQLIAGPGGEIFWPHATDTGPMNVAAQNLYQFGYLVLFVGLGVVAWRRFGAPYGLFVFGSLALPLAAPTDDWPLLSMPRFGLGIFPIFLALAYLGSRPRLHVATIAISAFLLCLSVVQWVTFQWVA